MQNLISFQEWDSTGKKMDLQTGFIVNKFGMDNAKESLAPREQTFCITDDMLDEKAPPERIKKFQSIVGCLIYLMIWTRHDIDYSVNLLWQYLSRLSKTLVKAGKNVLAYLKHTRTLGLRFPLPGGTPHNNHSGIVTGFYWRKQCWLFNHKMIYRRTCAFHWTWYSTLESGTTTNCNSLYSRKTLSTAESELVQISMAVQDV